MAESTNNPWRLAQYEIVAARRANYEQLLWQVPVLAMTAQSFLLAIGLNEGIGAWSRLGASALGVLASLMSITLMARHRQGVEFDSQWLANLEEEMLGSEAVMHGPRWAEKRDLQPLRIPGGELGPLTKQFRLWMFGLAIFGAVSIIMLAVALIDIVSACP